ncbi:TetR/AcrR family transcriptional regulator [Lactobacillaceae bacterium Melli_B3]
MNVSDRKIIDSFLLLINEYPISKIKNSNIIKWAGISKSTFYNNFKDGADVLKKFEIIINNQILHACVNEYRNQKLAGLTPQQMINIFIDAAFPILYHNRDRIKIIQHSAVKNIWARSFDIRYIRIIKELFPENDPDNTRIFVKLINSILFLWLNELLPMDEANFRTLIKHSYQIKCSHLFDKNHYYSLLRNNLAKS